jgi:hypothetical protein
MRSIPQFPLLFPVSLLHFLRKPRVFALFGIFHLVPLRTVCLLCLVSSISLANGMDLDVVVFVMRIEKLAISYSLSSCSMVTQRLVIMVRDDGPT